jgi:hypothetical protein
MAPRLLVEAFKELGLEREQVFPLRYSTRVPLEATGLLAQGDPPRCSPTVIEIVQRVGDVDDTAVGRAGLRVG